METVITQVEGAASGRIGDYVLLGELGRGGMGVVYRAEDAKLKREVALKVMLPQFAANPQAKARFVREARAQAKVEHEHVAAIYRVDEFQGLPYLVMPLLKGMTLHTALRANPRPPLLEVIRLGREMAEGLAAAHEKGLVHRDIKPANVWLEGKKLRVKVLDFGLARVSDTDPEDSNGPVTREGAVVGTPAYMSPEQGRGLPVDPRTDLWSLGVVLYQMTTGGLPFRGATTLAILTSLAIDHPPPPITVNPGVPQPLSDLIMRLLAKDPAYRPPTAEFAAEQLRAIEMEWGNAARMIPQAAQPLIVFPQAGSDPFADLDATEVISVPNAQLVDRSGVTRVDAPSRHRPIPRIALVGAAFLAVVTVAIIGITRTRGTQATTDPEPPLRQPPRQTLPFDSPERWAKAPNLLANIDPGNLPHWGEWEDVPTGGVQSSGQPGAWLAVRVRPPATEYDVRLEFTRVGGNNGLGLLFPRPLSPTRVLFFAMGGNDNRDVGLEAVENQPLGSEQNPSTQKLNLIGDRNRHNVIVRIRKTSIRAWIDGKHNWVFNTDWSNTDCLAVWNRASPTDAEFLGLASWSSPTHFHSLQVLPAP